MPSFNFLDFCRPRFVMPVYTTYSRLPKVKRTTPHLMAKDRLQYGLSKKHAHGAVDVERSIGITCTRYAAQKGVTRPVALMKWSFDDYVVEEELPVEAFSTYAMSSPPSAIPAESAITAPSSSPTSTSPGASIPSSYVVRVVSEGVADTVVERLLRERLPRSIPFHILTPVDFVSSASRYVWLRCSADAEDGKAALPRAFLSEQHWRTGAGEIYVSSAQRINVDAKALRFPPHLLPRTRYTVTLRNIQNSLGGVLPQLRSVARHGFLNYSHVARHGVGLACVYKDAKLLLERDYAGFVHRYLKRLTEGTTQVQREMPLLLDVLATPRSSFRDWRGALESLEAAVRSDAQVYERTRQSGLYPPHHDLLVDFVRRAADIMPRHRDSAQVIREAVHPLVLQETLRAITDVHFNAMASLRWQRQQEGGVAVGDTVMRSKGTGASPVSSNATSRHLDCFMGAADHINGSMTSSAHQDWSTLGTSAANSSSERPYNDAKVITSKAEAASYELSDVVLPTFGRGIDDPIAFPACEEGSNTAALFTNLVRELRVEGLPEMRLAPQATYRPLLQRPQDVAFYLVDEQRGWDWEEDAGSTALKKTLYRDQEGVLRYRSPLARRTGKSMVARIGLRNEAARNFFLKPARKPGMTCVVQLTLPAGCHVTSALREAFMVATVSPSAIFRLLAS